MGVINVTPDSFSGDGVLDTDTLVARGVQMEKDGADIIDVGGESTRPGSTPIPLEEELRRVIPVVKKLSENVRMPISVDTYKARTARRRIAPRDTRRQKTLRKRPYADIGRYLQSRSGATGDSERRTDD